jgi:hypothetical protein
MNRPQRVRDKTVLVEVAPMAMFPDLPETPQPAPTSAQLEILEALEGKATHVRDRPEPPDRLVWEVALGVFGIASLLVGVVLVFFFAALGSVVLVLGGILCAVAFEGAARREVVLDSQSLPPPEH